MHKPLSNCPICGGELELIKLKCISCNLTLEGKLPTSRLASLSFDQQQFVEVFLLTRGNIKEVERELGISYPTVRKKLEEVIQTLGALPQRAMRSTVEGVDFLMHRTQPSTSRTDKTGRDLERTQKKKKRTRRDTTEPSSRAQRKR
ncbi:DUF2089 domain-containing protein [Candidatus Poribacteria bacterium]|nr:DUF2089 domain-containing protein [Candidatus Poribacteria bacterium]